MPRAVLKSGVIYPLEPLPADWEEGTELLVEKPGRRRRKRFQAARLEEWERDLEALARLIPPEADAQLEAAIARIRSEVKQELPREVKLE